MWAPFDRICKDTNFAQIRAYLSQKKQKGHVLEGERGNVLGDADNFFFANSNTLCTFADGMTILKLNFKFVTTSRKKMIDRELTNTIK